MRDDEAMERALEVSSVARRRTAPNPWVGCVIVRDGEIVGEGASQPPGSARGSRRTRAGGRPSAGERLRRRSNPARTTAARRRVPTR